MKIFLSIKYHADHHNRQLIERLTHHLRPHDVRCIMRDVERWGATLFAPPELMRRTFAEIDACEQVLVELSEKGVGIGLEAGYAYAKGKSITVIAQHGCDISETLRGIAQQVVWYEDVMELKIF